MKSVKRILKNVVCGMVLITALVIAGLVIREIMIWVARLTSSFVALNAMDRVFIYGTCQLGLWTQFTVSFRKIINSKS